LASPDMIGNISGAYIAVISDGSVPFSVSSKPLARSDWIAALTLTTKPRLVGTGSPVESNG
jgi:hypothetical protein